MCPDNATNSPGTRSARRKWLPFIPPPTLEQLPLEGGYFFWKREPNSKLETASGNARRAFRQICKEAKVLNGHPHRFRDTFAVRLLQAGVPL